MFKTNQELRDEIKALKIDRDEWKATAEYAVQEQNNAADVANTYLQAIKDGTARTIKVKDKSAKRGAKV